MNDLTKFRQVDSWRSALGLLPIPLRQNGMNADRFILLNGVSGNFCLDFAGGIDRTGRCSAAWSSDVGHYVTIDGESVIVNRWDRPSAEEKYSARSVLGQIHDFHRHLERSTPDRSQNIVSHVLRIFRRVRAALSEEDDGKKSLQLFLYLLASSVLGQPRVNEDPDSLGVPAEAIEVKRLISQATIDSLYSDLMGPGRYDVLRPEMDLVLRHAAGSLFQEAHLQAQIPLNMWLPGLERPAQISSEITVKETGVYFTPPTLARTLAEEAVRAMRFDQNDDLMIFDPACGSGELLRESLRLLQLRGHTGKIKIIGWDKSDSSVSMARFVLAWERNAWPVDQVEITIKNADSITASAWPSNTDLLIMNPPFQSWQQMEPQQQEAVSQILGSSLRNKPNLAMAFAIRSLKALGERGVLAMIAPNSLLEGSSGKNLRESIAAVLTPALIAKLGDQNIFAHALVDAGMYVGRHKSDEDRISSAVLWADAQSNSLSRALRGLRKWRGAEAEPLYGEGYSVYLRNDLGLTGAPWIARGYHAWVSYERIKHGKRTLSAKRLFDIRQGVRLGNDIFIVNKEFVMRLPKSEKRFFRPAVMNPSITNAELNDAYYVFYPYTLGLPPITDEDDLRTNVPTYFEKSLLPIKDKLAARKSLAKSPDLKWWDLIWHRTWQEQQAPRLVSKYFGGKHSFAFDKDGAFVVVVGNAWLLNRGELALDITDQEIYLATLAYLNSDTAESLLQYVSVQVSGGQWDLSNRFMGEMLIPNFAKVRAAELADLVKLGSAICDGAFERWRDIDETVISILNG